MAQAAGMIDSVESWLVFLIVAAVALTFAGALIGRVYFSDSTPRGNPRKFD